MKEINIGRVLIKNRHKRALHRMNWLTIWVFLKGLFQNGKREFPIVKDTTPNMMNPRLYTTSYNKP